MSHENNFSIVRVLPLEWGEHKENQLLRLEKGSVVRFVLGPSLAGMPVRLFINQPKSPGVAIDPPQFRELSWSSPQTKFAIADTFSEVQLHTAGPLHYRFYVDDSLNGEDTTKRIPNGSGYIQVAPTLTIGTDEDSLPLDSIQCQTVLAKLLGPFPDWEARLRVTKESGYNMIHITPTQELGSSYSSYCIRNNLVPNPSFGPSCTYDAIKDLVEKIKCEWGVVTITDVVWNHVASDCPWISEHPECGYNLHNSPHLKPAWLLDRALYYFSNQIAHKNWEHRGLPPAINNEDHLNALRAVLYDSVLPPLKLHEFFQVDVENLVKQFGDYIEKSVACPSGDTPQAEFSIIPGNWGRFGWTVNMADALSRFNCARTDSASDSERRDRCMNDFKHFLYEQNNKAGEVCWSHITAAVEAIIGHVRYQRVDHHGFRFKEVTEKCPLVDAYFTFHNEDSSLEQEEPLMHKKEVNQRFMVHNGWVMNDEPLKNFAEYPSQVYLRRELICWADNVKLRYGNSRSDCPFLWDLMKKYTEQTATIFHGVRLDNCHSTPLHVAEYLIACARKIRPDLYVVAELFTGSEELDNIFVNRLGITSLVREAQSAGDSHEEGRLVYKYGGDPVGAFMKSDSQKLSPVIAHAMFMDQTHDNPCPIKTRTIFDIFPSAALVSMASCATGSNRGYDELVPYQIDVVTEKRLYAKWTDEQKVVPGEVNMESGIIHGKRVLNNLHSFLGTNGYTQVFVDQITEDIVAVTRHNPESHQSVVLVARTVFNNGAFGRKSFGKPLSIVGVVDEILFEGRFGAKVDINTGSTGGGGSSDKYITGLTDYVLEISEHVKIFASDMVEIVSEPESDVQEIDFCDFPPGSVIAFRVSLKRHMKDAILNIRNGLQEFGFRVRSLSGSRIKERTKPKEEQIIPIMGGLTPLDLNRVLFRCHEEEADEGHGGGAYNVPRLGSLVYCGLYGFIHPLKTIRFNNDLGHPVCDNVRNGEWMMKYITKRLFQSPFTRDLAKCLDESFTELQRVPHYLKPCYFDAILFGAHERIRAELFGLPHFSTGIFRNWGRDTFISVPGLLLTTGRFDEARHIILSYGGCLRHGLIPNLLGEGKCARYNCRDAVWWWLHCIKLYVMMAPGGPSILKDVVQRIYPTDDAIIGQTPSQEEKLENTMQEALQRHFEGIKFRERNAGFQIDEHMRDEGFSVEACIDFETGFPCGGNEWNCGTWMDKMGSSEKAGNRGKPATPRDGSAVELVGLCYSVVSWLDEASKRKLYAFDGVAANVDGKDHKWRWGDWVEKLKGSFEDRFWIPSTVDSVLSAHVDPKLIHKRGIYKDTCGASQPWSDYQLRPNFPIAIAVAPALFTPKNAFTALKNVEKFLLGPLGIKTLDPDDWAYDGNYVNSDDSADGRRAKGFNYHQGPEWLWPVGYFLRAKFVTARRMNDEKLEKAFVSQIHRRLSKYWRFLKDSPWGALPELTNANGAFCGDSCCAQAWSSACLLEVIRDLHDAGEKGSTS